MGGRRTSSAETIPVRSRALIPAALGCGLLWVGTVAIAGLKLGTPTLIALGAVGVLTTALVVLLLQHQHSRLHSFARTDALTGLANHGNFHETLAADLDLAREQGSPLGLVILDLDNFKPVNDAHGHPYGDEVLRGVGAALRGAVPAGGQAARIGGAEFGADPARRRRQHHLRDRRAGAGRGCRDPRRRLRAHLLRRGRSLP